jgi:folate-binding protein YgfZ
MAKNTPIIASDHNYELIRLNLGIPEGHKDLIELKSFPLEFGMDKLNAIDFDKGCYVGQEVTSRTKYRGTIRKELFIIRGEDLPPSGDDIIIDQNKIGIICSKLQNTGLALIQSEEYQKLEGLKLNFSLFKIIL